MPEKLPQQHTHTLITLAGPTAIGKTRTAIFLARHFNTEIISADSRQFYHNLKIGTASPTSEELAAVKHHFVGHLSIDKYYNVSRFEQDVLTLLPGLFKKHPLVILTGGSGLYIDAVCKGIDDLPDPDDALRAEIKRWHAEKGLTFLQEKLRQFDPEYYEIVDKANPNRLMRALEVCITTGQTFTSLRKNKSKPREFNIIKIGLNRPREELFSNISRRTDKMINDGLVDEVKSLATFRHHNALNTVGYKEIFDFLDKKLTLERAIENIKTNTRRYAKRQLTWFKRDKEIQWFLPEETGQMISYIEMKLSGL
jgi:tRNA dimethylallyltransferase